MGFTDTATWVSGAWGIGAERRPWAQTSRALPAVPQGSWQNGTVVPICRDRMRRNLHQVAGRAHLERARLLHHSLKLTVRLAERRRTNLEAPITRDSVGEFLGEFSPIRALKRFPRVTFSALGRSESM